MTDDPDLAFLAQRLVPPDLADPSASRVRARELTGEDIVTAAQEYDVRRRRPLRATVCARSGRSDPGSTTKFEPIKVYGRGGDSPQVDLRARPTRDLVQADGRLEAFIQTPTPGRLRRGVCG